jgi:hypothetical protein
MPPLLNPTPSTLNGITELGIVEEPIPGVAAQINDPFPAFFQPALSVFELFFQRCFGNPLPCFPANVDNPLPLLSQKLLPGFAAQINDPFPAFFQPALSVFELFFQRCFGNPLPCFPANVDNPLPLLGQKLLHGKQFVLESGLIGVEARR